MKTFIILATLMLIGVLGISLAYFVATKSMMRVQMDALIDQNKQMRGEMDGVIAMLAEFENDKTKVKKAGSNVSINMAYIAGLICSDEGKNIKSGSGNEKMCLGEEYKWPVIGACGKNDSDTRWIVKNEDGSNWNITLDCKEFTDCNGPKNAICTSVAGCEFAGSCK